MMPSYSDDKCSFKLLTASEDLALSVKFKLNSKYKYNVYSVVFFNTRCDGISDNERRVFTQFVMGLVF